MAKPDTGLVESELTLNLAGDDGLEFKTSDGQQFKFKPDKTKGYVRFQMASGFPNVISGGLALTSATVANSFATLLHQPFDYEHQIAAYHDDPEGKKPNHVTDRILGSVVAVDFPNRPAEGWKISASPESAPKIVGVASYAKLAQGMRKVLGEHMAGRHQYSVSMENDYDFNQSGFAIHRAGKEPLKPFASSTPDDMAEAGFDYVPTTEAPKDLVKCFSREKKKIISTFRGRIPVLVMGGLDGEVHFSGVGLVKYAAERAAGIQSFAASGASPLVQPLQELAELLSGMALKKVSEKC